MIKLKSKKLTFQSKKRLDSSIESFIENLPFKLTKDQEYALQDIKKDLNSDVSARRIIMGDVGSGKTILILASVVIAYPNRSILMAPTTILVKQIFLEAKKYLPKDIKIALITNKTKKIDLNEYDFILGTHALLYKNLPTFALLMVDEQHRFGTKQRNILLNLDNTNDKKAHFLQFSATPIPRTMAMIESNYINFSFLKLFFSKFRVTDLR